MSLRDLYVRWKAKYIFALLVFGALVFSPLGASLANAPAVSAQDQTQASQAIITRSTAEEYYLRAVNELRSSYNLRPLLIDSNLTKSAISKGQDMVDYAYWGHYPTNRPSFSDFIWADSPKATRVGENLAKCYTVRQDAFNALKNSPTHLANMLGDYTNFGVAEIYNPFNNCTYTAMHFALFL
jgi:uncharacterized protein YkwD